MKEEPKSSGSSFILPPSSPQKLATALPVGRWFYARGKQKIGPLSWTELCQLARSGQLHPPDMVLSEGAKRWVQADTLAGLFTPAPTATLLEAAPAPMATLLQAAQPTGSEASALEGIAEGKPPVLDHDRELDAPTDDAPAQDFGLAAPESSTDKPGPRSRWLITSVAAAGVLLTAVAGVLLVAGFWRTPPVDHSNGSNVGNSDVRGPKDSHPSPLEPKHAIPAPISIVFDTQLASLKYVGTEFRSALHDGMRAAWEKITGSRVAISFEPAVIYPADRQRNVPLHFSGGPELPGPTNTQNAGFPITAMFPAKHKIREVQASLSEEGEKRTKGEGENGRKGEGEKGRKTESVKGSSPLLPLSPSPILLLTPEKSIPNLKNSICLLPKSPLAAGTTYRVDLALNLDGKPWNKTWTFRTCDDLDSSGDFARKALAKINDYRRLAGLSAVVLDAELSDGCRKHASYIVLNYEHPSLKGLGAHNEDPNLPGFSPEGQRAGKAGNITMGEDDPVVAIDAWMATLFHRVPILDPRVQRIGFGCARGPRLSWVSVLNILSGKEKGDFKQPVAYPADGQADVPLCFPSREIPDPIPDNQGGKAGYPFTVTFPDGKVLRNASGCLVDDQGKVVPAWFSSPEQPANPMYAGHQGTTICLIPHDPLRPHAVYGVKLNGTLEGQAWNRAWTFTTGAAGIDPSKAATDVLERINAIRVQAGLSQVTLDLNSAKGCTAHARYLLLTSGLRAKQANLNDEDPTLPGFSAAGQATAGRAHIFFFATEPSVQVDTLMACLSRSFILAPELRRIGFGCSLEIGRGWYCVLDLNLRGGG